MLNRRLLTVLVCFYLVMGVSGAKAQFFVFNCIPDSTNLDPDTVPANIVHPFNFSLTQTGNSTFTGDILFLSTVNNANLDTLGPQVNVTLAPGTILPFNLTDSVAAPRYNTSPSGVNVVVIWPFCPTQNVTVSDSFIKLVVIGAPSSTDHQSDLFKRVKVYPNPARDRVQVDAPRLENEIQSVWLANPQGWVVRKWEEYQAELDLQNLAAGSYLLVFNLKDGSRFTRTVILQ